MVVPGLLVEVNKLKASHMLIYFRQENHIDKEPLCKECKLLWVQVSLTSCFVPVFSQSAQAFCEKKKKVSQSSSATFTAKIYEDFLFLAINSLSPSMQDAIQSSHSRVWEGENDWCAFTCALLALVHEGSRQNGALSSCLGWY